MVSPDTERSSTPAHPVRSVGKALELLLLLREHGQLGVSEASRELGIARSTAHRLMSMLVQYGFAQRDGASRYRLGPALVSLGLAAVVQLDIRRRARPHMERLAQEVQETVTLMTLEGAQVRFLDCAESPRTIRVAARTGLTRPAHCTSAGKAMLASLPVKELVRLYPHQTLKRLTEASITRRDDLFAVLEDVRRDGYGTNLGESDCGLRAVGVAIPGLLDQPLAGLGVSAPAERLSSSEILRVAKAAIQTVEAISESFELPTKG